MDFGTLGFLLDAQHVFAANFRNAKSLRVRDFLQKDLRAPSLLSEILDSAANVVLDDVVAQNYANRLAGGKVLRQAQRLSDAAFAFLIGIIQMLQSEIPAVSQQPEKIACVLSACDQKISWMPAFTRV